LFRKNQSLNWSSKNLKSESQKNNKEARTKIFLNKFRSERKSDPKIIKTGEKFCQIFLDSRFNFLSQNFYKIFEGRIRICGNNVPTNAPNKLGVIAHLGRIGHRISSRQFVIDPKAR